MPWTWYMVWINGLSAPTWDLYNETFVAAFLHVNVLVTGNCGILYPPPSPRTLRRSAPVPQSRNPPLLKTRHVTSMVGSPQEVEQNEQEDASGRGAAPRRVY